MSKSSSYGHAPSPHGACCRPKQLIEIGIAGILNCVLLQSLFRRSATETLGDGNLTLRQQRWSASPAGGPLHRRLPRSLTGEEPMGNKPRGVTCEKLIESLQNSNLQTVGGSLDMFQAVHHGTGPPSIATPHSALDSFSRASESGNLLELLAHAPQSISPGNQVDLLASLSEKVLGKSSTRELHERLEPQKQSWTGPTKPPPASVWMVQRHLAKPNLPLPGHGGSGSNSPKTGLGPSNTPEEKPCQTRPKSMWGGRNGNQGEVEKAMATNTLAMLVKPDKSLNSEAFALGADSPSPRGTPKDMIDMDNKMMDSSDGSDHNMDEQEEKNAANGSIGMGRAVSKNLVSERKRRKKLNEGLYTLRALVPRISKMDKASIIGDAIDYVRELQKEVEDLQSGISDLEACAVGEEVLSSVAEPSGVQICEVRSWDEEGSRSSDDKLSDESMAHLMAESVEQKILELDVSLMEDQVYHLQIFCTKGPGVFVQLMQSLESLGLEVLNANLSSLQDNILNTFIAEIKDWERMKTEDVKKAIMDVASRFGLQ